MDPPPPPAVSWRLQTRPPSSLTNPSAVILDRTLFLIKSLTPKGAPPPLPSDSQALELVSTSPRAASLETAQQQRR